MISVFETRRDSYNNNNNENEIEITHRETDNRKKMKRVAMPIFIIEIK